MIDLQRDILEEFALFPPVFEGENAFHTIIDPYKKAKKLAVWRAFNPKSVAESRERGKARKKITDAVWAAQNRERINANKRAWEAKNREKARAQKRESARRCRARKKAQCIQ